LFLSAFGDGRTAAELNRRDWDRFIKDRRTGRLRPNGTSKPRTVGDRTIERDLKWLHAVLNWATTAGDGRGGSLLDKNPVRGLPKPKETSPRRPVISDQRYRAMLSVAERMDWRFRVALVLAHETGHRISAIARLRWSDLDLQGRSVHWAKENDKLGFEHRTPLTQEALEALQRARKNTPGVGRAWVLPAPQNASQSVSRYLLGTWWKRAESLAGLEPVPGLGWHALRRKMATELKDTPLKDLAALGGWKSPHTILMCYQRADEDTMREALEARKPLTGAIAG
jgi:integrase